MTEAASAPAAAGLLDRVDDVSWYHTIELGNGVTTPGHYDHRPYLHHYGLPDDLRGKTVLDMGAASGFFAFELERRGGRVTAADLPAWFEHDFGPNYEADQTVKSGQRYLHEPFELAHAILGSSVARHEINIYDISPANVGTFDLVFCGSLLIHLTDPVKALWNIAGVTKEKAIIATAIDAGAAEIPVATLIGHEAGDSWWIPTRACLELMTVSAGFAGIEWVSEFYLDYADGSRGAYHGVIHAYKNSEGWTENTRSAQDVLAQYGSRDHESVSARLARQRQRISELEAESQRQKALIAGYENGRLMRLMRLIRR